MTFFDILPSRAVISFVDTFFAVFVVGRGGRSGTAGPFVVGRGRSDTAGPFVVGRGRSRAGAPGRRLPLGMAAEVGRLLLGMAAVGRW